MLKMSKKTALLVIAVVAVALLYKRAVQE